MSKAKLALASGCLARCCFLATWADRVPRGERALDARPSPASGLLDTGNSPLLNTLDRRPPRG